MDPIWKHLPDCLTSYVIEWSDALVWRNGKYINRISMNDPRLKLFETVPTPELNKDKTCVMLKLNNFFLFKYVNQKETSTFAFFKKYNYFDEILPVRQVIEWTTIS